MLFKTCIGFFLLLNTKDNAQIKEHRRSQFISILTNTIYQKGNDHSHVKRKLG